MERAFAGAVVAAAVCAVAWMAVVRAVGNDAALVVAISGVLIGFAARAVARVRGTRVQVAAGVGVIVFLLLGEFLVYRQALESWLLELHAAEGAPPDEAWHRAREELDKMDLSRFVHLSASMSIFVALAVAFAGALWVTRAPHAVAAFEEPPPPAPPAVPRADPAVDASIVDSASPHGEGGAVARSRMTESREVPSHAEEPTP